MSLEKARQLMKEGNYQMAIMHYQNLIAKAPTDAKLYLELSTCLINSGQVDEAVVVAKQAQIHADNNFKSKCTLQLANLYLQQDRHEIAESLFCQLIANSKDLLQASISLSNLYLKCGDLSKAYKTLKAAEHLAKNDANFVLNLSLVMFNLRKANQAIELILQYMEKNGAHKDMLSNALMFCSYTTKHAHYQEQLKKNLTQIYQGKTSISGPSKEDKLRIGFVSADFCWHPVGYFLHGFLPYLRESNIEIYLYYNGAKIDSIAEKLKAIAKKFTFISNINCDAATANIRSDKLHALIDLSGHSAGNRLDIFDQRAAKVQISYLGYMESTNIANMDYLLTDESHIQGSEHEEYSEKIIYLPETRFCFSLPINPPEIAPAPFLTNGYLTLGSFANPAKISIETVNMWGEIMLKMPSARLKLHHKQWQDHELKESLLEEFIKIGITPGRLEFHGQSKYDSYLLNYREIDVILDTIPFCGATTTCEALWMGVPTINFTGNIPANRQGVSILNAIGESYFVAKDVKDATKILQDLQDRPEILHSFKEKIREKILQSPLGNGKLFAESFAKVLRSLV